MNDYTLVVLNQVVCAVSLGVVLFPLAIIALRALRAGRATFLAGLLYVALFGAAVIVWVRLPPVFAHANFHGYSLLRDILRFPEPALHRTGYGQASFFILGLFQRIFASGWEGVKLGNVFSVAGSLLCCSILAKRAGGILAATLTVCLGLFHPVFALSAVSEDSHPVGCFFGMLSLVLADTARQRSGSVAIALAAMGATVLAFYSRQTLFFWPLLVLALFVRGHPLAWISQRAALVSLFLVGLLLLFQAALFYPRDDPTVTARLLAYSLFLLPVPSFLLKHPLLRVEESLGVIVGLAGFILLVRRSNRALAVTTIGGLISFIFSFGASFHPGVGVEYCMRLPVFVLLLPAAGVGFAAVRQMLLSRLGSCLFPRIGTDILVLSFAALAPMPGFLQSTSYRDAQAQEYEILRAHLATDGAEELFFVYSTGPKTAATGGASLTQTPCWRPPPTVMRVTDSRPTVASGHRLYFQSIFCFSWSLSEIVRLPPDEIIATVMQWDLAKIADFLDAVWFRPEEAIAALGGVLPTGMRPECLEVIKGASDFELWGYVVVRRNELPHIYYTANIIPVGVWSLSESYAEQLEKVGLLKQ